MIKKMVVTCLLGVGLMLGGCETLTRDKDQQYRRYSRLADLNKRLLAEDIDSFFLLDKPSSLTHWYIQFE